MKLTWLLTIVTAAFVVAKPLDREVAAPTALVTRSINTAAAKPIVAIPLTSRSVAVASAAHPPCETLGRQSLCALKSTFTGWPWNWKKNFAKCIEKCKAKLMDAYPNYHPEDWQRPVDGAPPNGTHLNKEPISENEKLQNENEKLEHENKKIVDDRLAREKDKLENDKLMKEHEKLVDENKQLLTETKTPGLEKPANQTLKIEKSPNKKPLKDFPEEFELTAVNAKASATSAAAASAGSAIAASIPIASAVSTASISVAATAVDTATPTTSTYIPGDIFELLVVAEHASKASAAIASAAATAAAAANPHPISNNVDERRAPNDEYDYDDPDTPKSAFSSKPRTSATARASKTRATATPTIAAIPHKRQVIECEENIDGNNDPKLTMCHRAGLDCPPPLDHGKHPSVPRKRRPNSIPAIPLTKRYSSGCGMLNHTGCSFKSTWGSWFRNISDNYEKCMNKCRKEKNKFYNERVTKEDEEAEEDDDNDGNEY